MSLSEEFLLNRENTYEVIIVKEANLFEWVNAMHSINYYIGSYSNVIACVSPSQQSFLILQSPLSFVYYIVDRTKRGSGNLKTRKLNQPGSTMEDVQPPPTRRRPNSHVMSAPECPGASPVPLRRHSPSCYPCPSHRSQRTP